MYVFSFQNATSSVLLAVTSNYFLLEKRGVQLKGVVVKQMASERAKFSAPLTCQIFRLVQLLLNNSHGPLLAIMSWSVGFLVLFWCVTCFTLVSVLFLHMSGFPPV